MPRTLAVVFALLLVAAPAPAAGPLGYYRMPALHKDTLVFVAEGDLWKVPVSGGAAARLTTHPGEETYPAIEKLAIKGEKVSPIA